MAINPRMNLMQYMMLPIVPNAIKKGLFGGRHLLFMDLVNITAFLFQQGAILGRSKVDQINTLAKTFSEPGREGEVVDWIKTTATKRVDKYREIFGDEPTSFQTYIMATEFHTAGITMPIGTAQIVSSAQQHQKQVENQSKDKVPLDFIDSKLQASVIEGIGFGIAYPDLTARIYRSANENIDQANWAEARRHGLNLPENPTLITLEEQAETVLAMVATYAGQYRPELLEPLGLADRVD